MTAECTVPNKSILEPSMINASQWIYNWFPSWCLISLIVDCFTISMSRNHFIHCLFYYSQDKFFVPALNLWNIVLNTINAITASLCIQGSMLLGWSLTSLGHSGFLWRIQASPVKTENSWATAKILSCSYSPGLNNYIILYCNKV